MDLKNLIYETFKNGTEEEVLKFLREKVLFNCKNNEERWDMMNKKYKEWSEKLLLFKEYGVVSGSGLGCFNLSFITCKFKFCEKEIKDLKEYLYCIFCITYIVSLLGESTFKEIFYDFGELIYSSKYCRLLSNCFTLGIDSLEIEDTKIIEISKNEFLEDINKFYNISYYSYNKYDKPRLISGKFVEDMEIEYPKFKNILQYLQENLNECKIIKIYLKESSCHDHFTYVIKDIDSFYIVGIEKNT